LALDRDTFSDVEIIEAELTPEEKRSRHFLKPEEIIQLADSRIAVTNQWGIGNINHFINQARKLDYKIALLNSDVKNIYTNLN
jgi:hypothetical protein